MNALGPDNAFWDDGEWISWDSIPDEDEIGSSHLAKLEHEAELRLQFPNADIALRDEVLGRDHEEYGSGCVYHAAMIDHSTR